MPSRVTTAGLSALVLLAVSACGQPGSSGTTTSPDAASSAAPAVCRPVAGGDLVVLADDLHLQTVDNVVPAVHAASAQPAMIAALDALSALLDTATLVDLNRQVDIDRSTSSQVATAFVEQSGLDITDTSGSGTVVVGAGDFSESATLAESYAAVLRLAGYDATVQTVGNRETYLPALQSGELTVVPEYAGTLTEFLNLGLNGPDATPLASGDLDATVAALVGLGDEAGLVFGLPAQAADQNAFAVTTAFADEYGVTTLSELAETCGGVVLGGPPECSERAFCQPGLEQTYGLDIAELVSLDAGGPLTKAALRTGTVSLGLVFSSDAAFATTA